MEKVYFQLEGLKKNKVKQHAFSYNSSRNGRNFLACCSDMRGYVVLHLIKYILFAVIKGNLEIL